MSLDNTLLEGLLETPAGSGSRVDNSESNMLLEYFRSAREEILARVKYRDNWLALQLLAQIVLFALAQGVEVVGIRASQPNPSFLYLSIPISLLMVSLYHVEDSLIGYIGNYVSAISTAEAELASRGRVIRNWDASDQFQLYGMRTLPVRFIAQVTAFLFIPLGLIAIRIFGVQIWGIFQLAEIAIDSLFMLIICYVLFRGFALRRKINRMIVPGIIKLQ